MPNKQRTNVRKATGGDARSQPTATALALALIQLIQESGRFETITVRQILQRAGVGRTAFYAHFRSKEDVLHSTYEAIFGTHKEQLARDTSAKAAALPGGRIPRASRGRAAGDARISEGRTGRRYEDAVCRLRGRHHRVSNQRLALVNDGQAEASRPHVGGGAHRITRLVAGS